MINRSLLILVATFSLFVAFSQQFAPITYTPNFKQIDINADKCPIQLFVSPIGNDSYSGNKEVIVGKNGPFLTLERARDEVRKLKQKHLPKGGIAVNLLGGIYSFDKSFVLTADDGGTEGSPIVYRAWKDDDVRLLGGRRSGRAHV